MRARRSQRRRRVKELDVRFTYHPPKGDQPKKYDHIRTMGKSFAELLVIECPNGYELKIAIMKLEECIMWANASIARRT